MIKKPSKFTIKKLCDCGEPIPRNDDFCAQCYNESLGISTRHHVDFVDDSNPRIHVDYVNQ